MSAVLFDAGGTLFRMGRPVGEVYSEFAARYGRKVDPEILETRFREVFRRKTGPSDGPPAESNPKAERAWWRDLVHELFAGFGGVPDFERFFEELHLHFAHPDLWEMFPDVRTALKRLKEAGIKLAIVSNWDQRLEKLVERMGIHPDFSAIIVSSVVGVSKPDTGIFRIALERLGARASDAVHVGDSYRDDVLGAEGSGIRPLWLRRPGTPSEPGTGDLETQKVAVVCGLDEAAEHILSI